MSTRYSPVRHSTWGRSPVRVRLACVKHAASVQSEPESNSPVQILYKILTLAGENRNLKDFLPTRYSLVNEPPGLPAPPNLFGRREECLCSPSLPESTVFFASGKISFLPLFQKPSLVAKPECSREAPLCQHTAPKKFYFCRKRPPEATFAPRRRPKAPHLRATNARSAFLLYHTLRQSAPFSPPLKIRLLVLPVPS